jgi:hypothetical protein
LVRRALPPIPDERLQDVDPAEAAIYEDFELPRVNQEATSFLKKYFQNEIQAQRYCFTKASI